MKLLVLFWSLTGAIGKRLSDDNVGAYSAQASFFLFVSLFPFLMLLLSLMRFFPFEMNDLIRALTAVLPDGIKDFIVPTVTEIYARGTPAIISLTAVTTLWSASTGVNAVVRGLKRIAGDSDENWLILRFKSIFYMLMLIAVIILSLGLFVFGGVFIDKVMGILPNLGIIVLLSSGARWLCGVSVLTLIFCLLYVFAPRGRIKFSQALPGAALSAIGWAGFSWLYSFYVDNITNISVYGSLTLAVFFLLWMYICFYMLFIGAEINRWMASTNEQETQK